MAVATFGDLEAKLSSERFSGNTLVWQEGGWGPNNEIRVKVAQDNDNYYYLNGSKIVVQRKSGEKNLRFPYCFGCESKVGVLLAVAPIYDGPFPGSGSGRVDSVYTFYCKKCDGEPSGGQFLDIQL